MIEHNKLIFIVYPPGTLIDKISVLQWNRTFHYSVGGGGYRVLYTQCHILYISRFYKGHKCYKLHVSIMHKALATPFDHTQ